MNKKIILPIALLTLVSLAFLVSADVIPENSHPLDRCVKFVNLNEFSDVVLIGYYTGPMVDTYEAYQIQNGACLEKGYKFNSLNVYWTTKEKFNTLDLKNLKLESKKVVTGGRDNAGNPVYMDVYSPSDLTLLLEDVEPYGGYVDESNPLIKETIEYSIAGFSDGKLIVYKSKQTSEYNNGQPNKIETFDKPIVNNQRPNPTPKPQGFWSKIGCFFKRLFGRSC
ncbi:MAG: hypothetical protein QXX68_01355 [Candidatus Pacearchaeota archaeon]